MNWLYALLWFFGLADAIASPSKEQRPPTDRDKLDEYLGFCRTWRDSCRSDLRNDRVRSSARAAINNCFTHHAELETAVATGADVTALLAQATALNDEYRLAMDLAEADRSAGLNAHGDLEMAGYCLRELQRHHGDNTRYAGMLAQAHALNDNGDFEGASRLAKQLTVAGQSERYVRAWAQSVQELSSWRCVDGDPAAVAAYAQMPEVVATTAPADLIAGNAVTVGLDPTQTVLALATHERVISNNTCAGRWHHFVYPRYPDYKKVAQVADARVKYSDERFGALSPEKLSALLSYARACEGNGTFYGVPGIYATAQERHEKRTWELEQYDLGFAAVLKALEIADATFGPQDKRTRRVLFAAAFATRSRAYPLSDALRERLNEAVASTFKKS